MLINLMLTLSGPLVPGQQASVHTSGALSGEDVYLVIGDGYALDATCFSANCADVTNASVAKRLTSNNNGSAHTTFTVPLSFNASVIQAISPTDNSPVFGNLDTAPSVVFTPPPNIPVIITGFEAVCDPTDSWVSITVEYVGTANNLDVTVFDKALLQESYTVVPANNSGSVFSFAYADLPVGECSSSTWAVGVYDNTADDCIKDGPEELAVPSNCRVW